MNSEQESEHKIDGSTEVHLNDYEDIADANTCIGHFIEQVSNQKRPYSTKYVLHLLRLSVHFKATIRDDSTYCFVNCYKTQHTFSNRLPTKKTK